MRRYSFKLRHDQGLIEDESGIWLGDRGQAIKHAETVAHELMRCHEERTRSWCLDMYEDGERVEEILFATIDPTLAHLSSQSRASVERAAGIKRRHRDALAAIRVTWRESKALVARSRGKPYLATERGEPTIRAPRRGSRD